MIRIDNREFNLEIERKNIKNIYLRVQYPDTIKVTCDKTVSRDMIMRLIESRKEWIYKAFNKKEERFGSSKLIIDDYIYYRGIKYKLEFAYGNNGIRIEDDVLTVYSRKDSHDDAIRIFYELSKNEILKSVRKYEDRYLGILEDYGYHNHPVYKCRMMKSRWGVCYTNRNTVTMSSLLIHYDEKCIEAVLWHELLHFVIPNHSKRFHEVLEYHMPEYKKLMKELK